MGFDALSPWHLLIIAVIFVMLFGAKKLPDSARALGRSLRIFKAETSGLRHDENGNVVPEGQPQAQAQAVPPPPPLPAPPPASGVTGAPVSEPQRTNQPS
jgi:sec-independent protein translocase protein TatA